jgi:hypothetical protein
MENSDQMYCILCHGRGLNRWDYPCHRCKGTGYEPEVLELGKGAAGCQFNPYARPGGSSHNLNLSTQTEGPTPSPGTLR